MVKLDLFQEWKFGFYIRQLINVIQHINRNMEKTMWLSSQMQRKHLTDLTSIHDKALHKLTTEEIICNLIKSSFKRLTANIIVNGDTGSLYKNETKLTAITTSI